MRLNIINNFGDLQASAAHHGEDVAMPAGSIGTDIRLGDWAVDRHGTVGARPIEVPLQHPQFFATPGIMKVTVTHTVTS